MRRIGLDEAQRFQRDLKVLPQESMEKLQEGMSAKGFIAPLFLWYGKDALLDGTQRRDVLSATGWTVDGGIPVVEIEAKDEKDAAEKLLLITSQYASFDYGGVADFGATFGIDWNEFKLPVLPGFDMSAFDQAFNAPAIDGEFDDLDAELGDLEGSEDATISVIIPKKHRDAVVEWLANGETKSSGGFGRGVMKRCGLL